MKSKYVKPLLLFTGATLLATGCVVRERAVYRSPGVAVDAPVVEGEVDVTDAPPAQPPEEDVVTVAPAPGFVWIGGAWFWGGGGWRWQRGHWARPPHPGAMWVPHRYVERGGRHVWVRGGWR